MPNKPKRPCNYPTCGQLTTDSYCELHKQERHAYDKQRGNAAQRGYDSRWQKARKTYLAKHPLCLHCLDHGVYAAATVVDHITPHKGDKTLFWDSKNNWQPLCEMHHNRKTAREDMGSW
ncbi:5-methylcytosine-specific restriction protein A [Scopulibacillus darangshiensis]|uniref:Putative HNH nuclease YajD n=1 Tax=Scopulibacillus darangshiensis TaxID=442528 RepID=A0A4R2PE27_9BACL|nr:HNH endonuclease signature motif containing protein [Scopulibacillus darangshiensis]TCP32175.1 5-methylcytosine-specific restriction protein A [Scopulibacillus darangshiensis]